MAKAFLDIQIQWQQQSYRLAQENRSLSHKHGTGPYNVFILDTSSSLGQNGYKQTKEIFTDILEEYSKHPDIDENVGVIVCGRHVKCQHHFSNRYEDIKLSLNNVEFGGPSPIAAAFFLSRGFLISDFTKQLGTFHVPPRIILISDGRPTDFTDLYCDDSPQTETARDVDQLQQLTRKIGRTHPIFCIPVGRNPDMTTLELISGQSRGGRIVLPSDARQFAKYSQNTRTASMLPITLKNDGHDRERILTSLVSTFPDNAYTEMDQNEIIEMCFLEKSPCKFRDDVEEDIENEREKLYEERDTRLPSLGSRVRRGRDWHFSDQDNLGPGTVIGHCKKKGILVVEWDTCSRNTYRFGPMDSSIELFEVQVCNEPRILENELIATGCIVKRDWTVYEQDDDTDDIGSAISVQENGAVLVQWQNGFQKAYRYGYEGHFDLQICDPFSPEAARYLEDKIRKVAINFPDGVQPYHQDVKIDLGYVSDPSLKKHVDSREENTVTSKTIPILKVPKGVYFRNDKLKNEISDVETDGPTFSVSRNQWFWKSREGTWNPYSREMNDRIHKCYARNPKSTVIVTIHDQSYRVVIAKNIQINLTTRETSEIKLVINEPSP
ncbi:uncharacterized protein LOC111131204 isoform X2 [Crassostrea virginica]|uniref:Uncharacterized protein LOC111130522 n=1 Tax=Crassostrea virginica TaxID=6565 RepID=A0A8B8DYQ3_CRAVI|nr:uncharacterized protein LOC111130522 [Crassostrea virginica]XP_022334331.1 uncharacterized protein LOC111131204 [Crassostrea virginica]